MNEIWGLIENYQPFADSRGFGKQWKRMIDERTIEAARSAEWIAWEAGYDDAADAASEAIRVIGAALEVKP